MNPTPDHLDDEVLSALLDGSAGGDPDAPAVEAAAHLRACGRCSGRQGELEAARAALAAAPVEPVDELTRRRLLAAALQAADEARPSEVAIPARARARWGVRHPALMGSVAAVILGLLVGVPFVLGNDKSRDANTTLAAGGPGAGEELATAFLGDLGDLSDRENLRLRLTGGSAAQLNDPLAYGALEPGAPPAAGASTPAPAAAPVPGAAGLASTTTAAGYQAPTAAQRSGGGSSVSEKAAADSAAGAPSSNAEAATDDQAGRDRSDTDACVASLLNGPAQGGRLTASGTGTFEGRPAIVAVFDLSGGRVAFVADRSGCVVRDRFSV